jgi:HSP20 family protein
VKEEKPGWKTRRKETAMALMKLHDGKGTVPGPYRFLEEVDQLFDEFLGRRSSGPPEGRWDWAPAVDIEETKDAYLLKAETPGLRKEDVKITYSEGVLTVSGEKRSEKAEHDKKVHRVERCYGSFQRSFSLPGAVKADKIEAAYKDGILTVTVPKSEESKPREIEIKVT